MFYLYILKSSIDNGYYIGATKDVSKRIIEHNDGNVKSTKPRSPFTVVYTEEYETWGAARKREDFLKRNYQARKELLLNLGFDVK